MRGIRPTLPDPPTETSGLRTFPRRTMSGGAEVARVVRAGAQPWWFSSNAGGRFDLETPDGTCYVAEDDLTALLQVIGPDLSGGVVATETLDARRLRTLRLPRATILADATSRRALGFGVTAEIGAIVPYDRTRLWAQALRATGFEGIRWWPRHDPARARRAIALFGRAGARRSWPRGRERPIGPALRTRLAAECGIKIAAPPRLDRLTVAPDPPDRSGVSRSRGRARRG